MICTICNNEIYPDFFQVKEMMFGIRSIHQYFECSHCEALQIEKVPGDLQRYYPDNYYSFSQLPEIDIHVSFFKKIKSAHFLYNRNKILGRLLSMGYKVPPYISWLKTAGVEYHDAIL